MTRVEKNPPGRWAHQDAKARFSELVRRVRSDGSQHVTMHGRDEVAVIAAEEFAGSKVIAPARH
jgi:prevent-host-death family protein